VGKIQKKGWIAASIFKRKKKYKQFGTCNLGNWIVKLVNLYHILHVPSPKDGIYI